MLTNRSRLDSAMSCPVATRTLPMLLAELVELGREAWRISERERAVRNHSARGLTWSDALPSAC